MFKVIRLKHYDVYRVKKKFLFFFWRDWVMDKTVLTCSLQSAYQLMKKGRYGYDGPADLFQHGGLLETNYYGSAEEFRDAHIEEFI